MNVDSRQEIQAAIPHRSPMLLLDRITERDEERIVCEKSFGADEFFVQGHYPDFPLVPGVILCECAMQAGAVLLAARTSEEAGVPVVTRMSDVKFKQMVRPGDTVVIESKLKEQVVNAFFMTGKVSVDGKLAARLEFACALAAPPSEA